MNGLTGRGGRGVQFFVKKGQAPGRQREHKGFEDNDGFAQAGVNVVMQLIEPEPRRIRMNVQAGGELLGLLMKFDAQGTDAHFEDAKFVKESRPAAKENAVHQLIPLGILASRLAAIKRWIERGHGGRHGKMAPPLLNRAARRCEGFG